MRTVTVSDLLSIAGDAARIKPDRVLSILDPGEPVPCLGLGPERHTVLPCYDTDGVSGPTRADVAAILAFADGVPEDGRVVVHCHAGVSRSPAAALIMLMHWGQPLEIGDRPVSPNLRMLGLADRSGTLLRHGRELARRAEASAEASLRDGDLW